MVVIVPVEMLVDVLAKLVVVVTLTVVVVVVFVVAVWVWVRFPQLTFTVLMVIFVKFVKFAPTM